MHREASRRDRGGRLSGDVIGAAIEVHRHLGPGLLESAYRRCLVHELRLRGHQVLTEVPLELAYKSLLVGSAYRVDVVVDGCLIVEVKAVAALLPVHEAQLLTYLRLSGKPLGLLLNFGVQLLKDGGIIRLAM